MRRLGVWVLVLLGFLLLAGCDAKEKKKEIKTAFDAISVGDDRAITIHHMGEPQNIVYKNVLGFSRERVVWSDGDDVFCVEFFNGKAVYKSYKTSTEGANYAIK